MPGLLAAITAFGKVGFSGLLAFFQKRQAMKQAEQDHRFELEMLDKQAEVQQRLGAMRLEETQTESEARIIGAAIAAEGAEAVQRQKAYVAEGKGVSTWVLNLRAATRPGITWLLSGALVYVVLRMPSAQDLMLPVLMAGVELTWGFWFGSKITDQLNGKRR